MYQENCRNTIRGIPDDSDIDDKENFFGEDDFDKNFDDFENIGAKRNQSTGSVMTFERQSSTSSSSSFELQRRKIKFCSTWSDFRVQACLKVSELRPTPFPDLPWADKQEIWHRICKREKGVYIRAPGVEILQRHPTFMPKMRAILVDWMIEVCEVYRLHRETFYLGVDFLDRYLGASEDIPRPRVQLLGITCLFIAAKMEEIYPPKVREFAYVTDGACTEEEILSMELVILKELNWALTPMTPNAWVKLYMQVDQASYIMEVNGESPPDNEDLMQPLFSGSRFTSVMKILDLCILDFGCLSFPYSILASSAIYHCRDHQIDIFQASGYSYKDISECVDWMMPFVLSLRESFLQKNGISLVIQEKPVPGVSPDEVHNFQSHVTELVVYDRVLQRQAHLQEQKRRAEGIRSRNSSSEELSPPDDSGDSLGMMDTEQYSSSLVGVAAGNVYSSDDTW